MRLMTASTALTALALLALTTAARSQRAADTPQLILLKADDFARNARWQRFTDYVLRNDLKAGLGIICKQLEKDDAALAAWVRELSASGRFDFWHHGYDHRLNYQEGDKTVCEFRGTSYEHQKEHFDRACALAQEKLGLHFTAFGAPGNATDAVTARVLSEHPEIEAVFFGPQMSGKLVLQRWANAEVPTLKPNSQDFVSRYPTVQTRPYLVLQLHPGAWDDARFAEFEKISAFLKTQGVQFVTTGELVRHLARAGTTTP